MIEQSFSKSIATMEVEEPVEIVLESETILYEDTANLNGPTGSGFLDNALVEESPNQPLINEEFIETDIREALLLMAEDAGVDLIMDEKVTGIINTQVNNLPIDRAIEKVLMPLGFVSARHNDQFVVCPADPTSPLFPYVARRDEYRPAFLDANAMVETVPERLKQYVQLIENTNLIIVEAPAILADEILDRFAAIDQPIPQVVLEAIICVISPDSGFQFGLDWQHAVELNGENAFKLGATGLAMSGNYSPAGASALFDDFSNTSAFVKLLSENGYLTIRATPHVMAQDGEQANIAINRQTYFSVQPPTTANADNSSFFFQQEIQSVESGITLDITPHVRGDLVTIEIEKAEVSEDIRNANTELALNPFPIINRRSVSTTVHVKDGKTIVIGGLVQRETIDRINRVPGLSRIPLMGYLFENTQRQTREAEVVIFISPRIVKPNKVMDEFQVGVCQ
ncbi:type II secretion system protein GspD [Novipirellula herctigrandis]|uniref:type II secretion system protein GspD n=1 Tax=Novipirellula herctigrandis TaxID=2527986 RepID=UPI003AF3C813